MDPNYKPRSAEDVLNQILPIIPSSEEKIITELNNFKKNDLRYKSPELLKSCDAWEPFIQILNYYIPDQKEEWHLEIKRILENKTEN